MDIFPRSSRAAAAALNYRPRRSRLADAWVTSDRRGWVGKAKQGYRILPWFWGAGSLMAVLAGNTQGASWLVAAALLYASLGLLACVVLGPWLEARSSLGAHPARTKEALAFALLDPEIKSVMQGWLEQARRPALTPREEGLLIQWGLGKGALQDLDRKKASIHDPEIATLALDREFFLDFPRTPRLTKDDESLFSRYRRCVQMIESVLGHASRARAERLAREMEVALGSECLVESQRPTRL